MTRSFAGLIEDFYAGKLEYRDFERAARNIPPDPSLVIAHMSRAYDQRDLNKLSKALLVALAVPDRSFTALLCSIALDDQWLWGCQEMALEVLIDLADPASFEALVRLCIRPNLKLGDGNDWRKAVFAISALPIERERIKNALESIIESDNDLRHEANTTLEALNRHAT